MRLETLVIFGLAIWLILGLIDIVRTQKRRRNIPDAPGELQITIKETER